MITNLKIIKIKVYNDANLWYNSTLSKIKQHGLNNMPTYDFQNKETEEYVQKILSFSARDQYLEDNPHMKQVHLKAPRIIGERSGSVLKQAGNGWKEVQDRIKSGLPPSLKDKINTK